MLENEFEKGIRKQMEEFSLVPNEEVWKKVEIKMRADQSRRRLLYWMFTGLLLIGGTVGLFLFNGSNTSEITNVSNDKKATIDLPANKDAIIKNKSGISGQEKDLAKEDEKAPQQILQPSAETEASKIANRKNRSSTKAPDAHSTKEIPTSSKLSESRNNDNKIMTLSNIGDRKGVNRSLSQPRMEGRTNLPPHKYLLSQSGQELQQDLQEKLVAMGIKTGIRDSAALAKKDNDRKTNVTENSKKWNLGFTVSGGLSDNITGIGIISTKSYVTADQRSPVFSQSAPSSSNIVTSPSTLEYKSGPSFAGGVFLQKALTRKLSATVGVNYSFMSTKSHAGNKVDTMLSIYDSLLQKPTMVQPFYRAGNSTTYSNKYHLIQVPINLRFQLNKNNNRPFLFSIGLSPSFLFSSNALYLNNNANLYYREKKQFDHFMLFFQTEFLYTVTNKNSYQLLLGPGLEYGVTSFSKTATQTRQHLLFTGIKANITFK